MLASASAVNVARIAADLPDATPDDLVAEAPLDVLPGVSEPAPVTPAAPAPTPMPPPPVTVQSTCQSQRAFEIRLRERRGRVVRSASVLVAGKRVAVMRRRSDGRWVARVDLRGQPAGRYTVELRATLRGGRKLVWTRAYRTCTWKLAPSNKLSDPGAL